MALPILYSFRRCPYAIRARLALAYSEQTIELREVVLRNKPIAMLNISPKGTVPVLFLADGGVIDESRDIALWALSKNDPYGVLLDEPQLKAMNLLIDENDGEFKHYLDRYKYADRFPEETQEFYRKNAERFLVKLEKLLKESPFLFGEKISFADIAIIPFIRQFALVDKSWFDSSRYTYLQSWLDTLLNSEKFNLIMEKYKPWVEGDYCLLDLESRPREP